MKLCRRWLIGGGAQKPLHFVLRLGLQLPLLLQRLDLTQPRNLLLDACKQ